MRLAAPLAVPLAAAVALLVGARGLREVAVGLRAREAREVPYAPSPGAAPFLSLGYREVTADLLFVRLASYFGGDHSTGPGVAALVEAMVATDPQFRRAYEWGARSITAAQSGVDQATLLRAAAVLERGVREFPANWKIPYAAGQIYVVDLETKDPVQRRAWDDRGARLLEIAVRKPDAPAGAAVTAAFLRSRLGQHQRAVDGLREMFLVTNDTASRQRILAKLAELDHSDADETAAELERARRDLEAAHRRERPAIDLSMYLLVGAPAAPGFDLGELATGGPLITSQLFERLEPPSDPPAAPAPATP